MKKNYKLSLNILFKSLIILFLLTQNLLAEISYKEVKAKGSDKIYEVLLGQKGAFNTKLTYVTVTNNENGDPTYRLVISDYDGHNPQVLDNSLDPILSPTWSSDLKKLAYVSFKNNRSEVFIKYPFWGIKDEKLPRFDGIASAPSWHPDGERIALSLFSFEISPSI